MNPVPLLTSIEAKDVMACLDKSLQASFVKLQTAFSRLVMDVDTGLHNRVTKIETRFESAIGLLREENHALRAEIERLKGAKAAGRWRNPDAEEDAEKPAPVPAPVPDLSAARAAEADSIMAELPAMLTRGDLVERWGVSRNRVHKLLSSGAIKSIPSPGGIRLIRREAVADYVRVYGVPTPRHAP